MHRTVLVSLILLGLSLPAQGHELDQCTRHELMEKVLAQGYGELRIARGLSDNGKTVLELYISPGGSFTVTVTFTNRVSCILASGQQMDIKEAPPPVETMEP